VTVPAVLATCVALFATGCKHYGEDGKPEDDKITTGSNIRWLSAGGRTFIEPIIDHWTATMESLTHCTSTIFQLAAVVESTVFAMVTGLSLQLMHRSG
jgi:ABC-type phosphate transport system substrate-binding protein